MFGDEVVSIDGVLFYKTYLYYDFVLMLRLYRDDPISIDIKDRLLGLVEGQKAN